MLDGATCKINLLTNPRIRKMETNPPSASNNIK